MDKQGGTTQYLKLLDDTEDDQKLSERISKELTEVREIILTVLESMKIEKVVKMNINNN